jgi:Arc/MetJ-type ribon-helix-helix transcriptional regulator
MCRLNLTPEFAFKKIKKMKLVTLHVPETYIDGLEKLVDSNLYPNRSEAIRIAIRDLLKRELWG